MRRGITVVLILGAVFGLTLPAFAQAPRKNAIWARTTTETITLDGVLDEASWAGAESWVIRYGVDAGIPGSGWKEEGGKLAKDSTHALLKFLVNGNQLYMAAVVRDSSVGGSMDFNRFDGFLMALKDRRSAYPHPAPPAEYFMSWWDPEDTLHAQDPGKGPTFIGRWGTIPPYKNPRDSAMIANWDAATHVQGLSNSDAVIDTGYIVEMRFNLTPMGYDVTTQEGDIVEWNISVYDCDWLWPFQAAKFSINRTWWQGPWGNTAWYDEVRIYAKPSVNMTAALPAIEPDVRVRNAGALPGAVIDGNLNDLIWTYAPSFDIRYGDDLLRQTYPGVGKWRAGQYHPVVNGDTAEVVDPGDATVRWFFKQDTLYFGFDVRDKVVQYVPLVDRYDGFIVTINDRAVRWKDNNLDSRRLTFIVGPDGNVLPLDYLPYLRDTLQGARVALRLKAGTTVDTVGVPPDQGYTAELAVDLTKLGYPPGRGDGTLFVGIDLLDGDSFSTVIDSYGTRAWWYREYEHQCCPAWAYMDPQLYITTGVGDPPTPLRGGFQLLGNFPNPFRSLTMIRYVLAEPSAVTLEVFDIQGRQVAARTLGLQPAGQREAAFSQALPGGVYLYRLRISEHATGSVKSTLYGRMLVVK